MNDYQTLLCLGLLGIGCTSSEAGAPPKAVSDIVVVSDDTTSAEPAPPKTARAAIEPAPSASPLVIPTIHYCLIDDDAGALPPLTPLAQLTCPPTLRVLPLIATEIFGLEHMLAPDPILDPGRPEILFRIAKKYAEWECGEHAVCAQYPGSGRLFRSRDYREAAARTVGHIEELCAILRTEYPRSPHQCPN